MLVHYKYMYYQVRSCNSGAGARVRAWFPTLPTQNIVYFYVWVRGRPLPWDPLTPNTSAIQRAKIAAPGKSGRK
ncbi:MAG: hypothetical protein EZS28_021170 [Streblomastix strix]|uniref:Uncharacterized protein n=1 Tax=Streblomastix strix TaxID=222440 RepID=A0A5J4VLK4_9EUKA|nr:MAG: hypothetical protein EZS28_021170 [Streblomastix strix]